jgi:hypothetical protein
MYCPACGTQSIEAQKFCRSCGMALEPINASVSEHLSTLSGDISFEILTKRQRSIKRWERFGGFMGMIGFLILIIFIASFFIGLGVTRLFGGSLDVLNGIAPLVMAFAFPMILVGAGMTSLLPALSKQLSMKKSDRTPALSRADTTRELAERVPLGMLTSVTEQSTQLLDRSPED